jgi:hypothetical protein
MKAIIGILIFAAACGAQQPWVQPTIIQNPQMQTQSQNPCPSNAWMGSRCLPFCEDIHGNDSCKYRDIADMPKHLKLCDKYQHIVPHHTEDCSTNMIGCTRDVPDKCVENMHPVTEREWQEIQETLAKQQAVLKSENKTLLETLKAQGDLNSELQHITAAVDVMAKALKAAKERQ